MYKDYSIHLKHHENIRVKVVELLRKLLKKVSEERCRRGDFRGCLLADILDSPEITVLFPQEVYVPPGEKKTIDMLFGDLVAFDFKSHENELDEAIKDAKTKYWERISGVKYFITTTYDLWRMYRVDSSKKDLVPLPGYTDCDVNKAVEFLETQVIPEVRELKVPPLPENVESLYKQGYEKVHENLRRAFEGVRDDPRVKPLYEAYKSIMRMLYGEASEGFFEELFTKHTYMHMTVLASLAEALGYEGSLEDLCSGSLLRVEVALPYLNWWRVALHGDLRGTLMEVLKDVVMRAGLIDWSLETAEDVFRSLYEFLIEPDTRRRLGEYYTPLWLVDMMVREFDMRERIVLDPFCGSGTFLVRAFHRKVDLSEDVEKAFSEVIGYDVNPLAIAVARAELIISYFRRARREPDNPPLIYHIDTLAMWFGGESTLAPELTNLVNNAKSYLQMLINFNIVNVGKTSEVLAKLRDLEKSLTLSIRFAYNACKTDVYCLKREIENYLLNLLANEEDAFIKSFIDHFKMHRISRTIANLIDKHGGNDVWSVVLISIYAPILMTRFKPDVIITNPPWIPVTEFGAPYAENVRNYMLSKIKMRVGEKASQILAGADIATAALGKSIELAREGVAYIMNREQLFYNRSSSRAGILATYCMLRAALQNKKAVLKLSDIDFDAFQHGVYPAVVVMKR
jgi:hypothetical protein